MKKSSFLILFLCHFVLISCSDVNVHEEAGYGSPNIPTDPDDPNSPAHPNNAILSFTVTVGSTKKTCSIPKGATANTFTCSISFPESLLFYSQTAITTNVGIDSPCQILFFTPYIYKASVSATFNPEWSPDTREPINCSPSSAEIEQGCYSGAGLLVNKDYPTHFGIVNLVTTTPFTEAFLIESAKKTFHKSNRWISNNLAFSSRSSNLSVTGGRDGYIADSMSDYVLACKDNWNQLLYKLTMYISDEDESTGNPDPNSSTSNNIPDWNSVFDPALFIMPTYPNIYSKK